LEIVRIAEGKGHWLQIGIYKEKQGSQDGATVSYKVILVAKGYAQREGIDYNEIFSSIVKYFSIQILLTLVAQYDLELDQLDVKIVFLYGDLIRSL